MNTIKNIILGIGLFGFASLTHAAKAQNISQCDAALMPTQTILGSRQDVRLATLSIIDRQAFSRMKSGGGSGFDIIVGGAPLRAYQNYDKFSEARTHEFTAKSFNYQRHQANSYVQIGLGNNAAQAYIKCLQLFKNGVFVWFQDVSEDTVTIYVEYRRAPLGPKFVKLSQDRPHLIGATNTPDFDVKYEDGAPRAFGIERQKGTSLHFAINLDAGSGSALIPKPPVFKKDIHYYSYTALDQLFGIHRPPVEKSPRYCGGQTEIQCENKARTMCSKLGKTRMIEYFHRDEIRAVHALVCGD